MKKPFPNTVLSNVKCEVCGRKLKMNLITKNPDATKCYRHFKGIKKVSNVNAEVNP